MIFPVYNSTRRISLNALSSDLYDVMREIDEPYFFRIREFLENPRKPQYDGTLSRGGRRTSPPRRISDQVAFAEFDDVFHQLHMDLLATFGDRLDGKKRVLRTLMSFMYFNCDIGSKGMIQPEKYMRLSQCPLRVAARAPRGVTSVLCPTAPGSRAIDPRSFR